MKLILASASPRRRQLLRKIGIPFRVMPSHVSEKSNEKNPIRLVRRLALLKAQEVARKMVPLTLTLSPRGGERGKQKKSPRPPRGRGRSPQATGVRGPVVLGADTVVVLRHHILGKPRDARDAGRMLGRLSGTTHQVYTGVALVDAVSGRSVVSHARSDVRMKRIAPADLEPLSRRHLDKAGSYAIQEKRDPIAKVVKGSYDNVVGLPVRVVRKLLSSLRDGR